METKVNHLQLFEDFCKENQSVIDWFKKVVIRKNSKYIVNSFAESDIVKSKWNRNNCTISLSYDRLDSICITISKKGVELTKSTFPEYCSDIATEVFSLYGTVLGLMQRKMLIDSYKDGNPFEE